MTETNIACTPDVAVVIPAFNSGPYLDQALASVAGQTMGPGTVVVVDDCSTDDTAERARRWQGRLPLELIRLTDNHGPGPARHLAIQATSTPLLAMLDADDLFLPDHLDTMAAAHAASSGLVSAQELSWYPGMGLTAPRMPKRFPAPPHQLSSLLRQNFVNFGFFSRDLYELSGGFRDQPCEDWNLWIRMLRAGAEITMASHPTAVHRVWDGSRSFDAARTAERGIAVLTAQLGDARSPAEVAAVRAGLRTLRGKLCFYRAMQLAAQGRLAQARRAALAGLPAGGPRAAAGLLAVTTAPALAVRLERLTRPYRVHVGSYTPLPDAAASGSPPPAPVHGQPAPPGGGDTAPPPTDRAVRNGEEPG
ncbi:MAG TPA: glycosyltransferase family A protein [Streptosporangiaceae bacterium]|nr:glycosyltransferase family A protein [Streptosporangiaceae bacterium]